MRFDVGDLPAPLPDLLHRHVLVVEDDYGQAAELEAALPEYGAVIVGPAASVGAALALVAQTPELAAAVLDVDLAGEIVFPVADALLGRGLPFVFVTGFDRAVFPRRFSGMPTLAKPVAAFAVAEALMA